MNKEVEDLINEIVWWIPLKNKRNKLRNKLINIIQSKINCIEDLNKLISERENIKNIVYDEILCYPLNWLKYIDSDNFLVKL